MDEAGGEIVVYTSPDGGPRVQLRAVEGTVRLAQAEIARLYGTSVQNIDQITRRVLDDGEVGRATINSELKVAQEGAGVGGPDRPFLEFDEREVLAGPGTVSAERMRVQVAERYASYDERRRAREAERAAVEELDDLRELTALEQRREGP